MRSKALHCDATTANPSSLYARAQALSGFDAVALLVPNRDDVRLWSARLDDLGEPHDGLVQGHAGGAVLVGLHDPDGIEIRIYAD